MPARTTVAPRRRPGWFAFFFRFPENKIQRIFFLVFTGYLQRAETGLKVIQIFMGKFSILFKFLNTEINSAVCCRISISLVDQSLDHVDHSVDFLCCLRIGGGRFHIHCIHIFSALCDITLGNFLCTYPFFNCFLNDLVIYVSEVGYKINFIAFVFHISAYCIKNDHRTCISDMDQIINCRSADIHADFSLFQRYKFFFSASQCIKKFHSFFPPISYQDQITFNPDLLFMSGG